jgi:hypothetical protein
MSRLREGNGSIGKDTAEQSRRGLEAGSHLSRYSPARRSAAAKEVKLHPLMVSR